MSLSRLQKKLIILRYNKSRLWTTYSQKHPNLGAGKLIEELFGVNADKNISRWIGDVGTVPNVPWNKWSENVLSVLKNDSRANIFDDSISSSKFGSILGLSRHSCKYLIDCVYAEKNNLFESIIYDRKTVESFIDNISGLYQLFLFIPERRAYAPAALTIRYYLPLNSNPARNAGYRIRCRATVSSIHEHRNGNNERRVEYDGYLSYDSKGMSFSFESRIFDGERRKMFLSFQNELHRVGDREYCFGGYLRSSSIHLSKNNFGPAAIILINSVPSIKIESNLSEFTDDHGLESRSKELCTDEVDKDFVRGFLSKHGWVT